MWAHKMPCQVTASCEDDSLDLFGALVTLFSFAHSYDQCFGSGSGIRCLFDPWIRDPGWIKSWDPDPG
jgi:hypothetical protein